MLLGIEEARGATLREFISGNHLPFSLPLFSLFISDSP